MSIPQRIKQLANQVRNAVYGKDVREAIAESMEVTGETAEEAKNRSIEQTERVDTLIRENPQPSEVVDARLGHPTLRDKLNSVDSQLAQTETKLEQLVVNVKSFGAKGDGATDDSSAILSAIKFLKENGKGILFFPPGIYMISKTLYLPSNIILTGAGREKTIIKAINESLFDDVVPFQNAPGRNIYRTMITTESAGINNPIDEVKNIIIEHITVDWNGCRTQEGTTVRANAPVMIDKARNVTLYDVEILDARPKEYEWRRNRASGASLLFSWAIDCVADRCVLHDAEYECLSVRHLSRDITFKNGVIYCVHTNFHAVQLARPTVSGLNGVGPLYFLNNKVYISKTPDAVTAHEGDGFFVHNNTIKYIPHPESRFHTAIWVFDGCKNFNISNNFIDLSEFDKERPVSAVLTGAAHYPVRGAYNGIIKNNIVKVKFPASPDDRYLGNLSDWIDVEEAPGLYIHPLFGGARNQIGNVNVIFDGNVTEILEYPDQPLTVFAFSGYRSSIINNQVRFGSPNESLSVTNGPIGIKIVNGYNLTVSGNKIGRTRGSGNIPLPGYSQGIVLTEEEFPGIDFKGTIFDVILTANDIANVRDKSFFMDPNIDEERIINELNFYKKSIVPK